jgi:hypothetical protein
MSKELSSLSQLVSTVDANDAVSVSVTVIAGSTRLSGRIISEVVYRETLAAVVRKGNAAPAAAIFDEMTKLAEAKRSENERRRAERPHSDVPTSPEYVHLIEEGPEGTVWCLPLEHVQAWTIHSYGLDADLLA